MLIINSIFALFILSISYISKLLNVKLFLYNYDDFSLIDSVHSKSFMNKGNILIKDLEFKLLTKLGIILNDLSEAGIESFNPHLKRFFKKIDIYEHIEEFTNQNVHFSLISMDNVLEHVIDPEDLLEKVKLIMKDNSVLRITVPNDFSAFQHMLINNMRKIKKIMIIEIIIFIIKYIPYINLEL